MPLLYQPRRRRVVSRSSAVYLPNTFFTAENAEYAEFLVKTSANSVCSVVNPPIAPKRVIPNVPAAKPRVAPLRTYPKIAAFVLEGLGCTPGCHAVFNTTGTKEPPRSLKSALRVAFVPLGVIKAR